MIGCRSALRFEKPIPELLAIDKEIGQPYKFNPIIYNSEAWSRRLELPWATRQLSSFENLMILDVGSGDSALPIYLSRNGARVVSVDLNLVRRESDGDVSKIKASLPSLPFRDCSFDAVVCISVLEHVTAGLPECFAELCRVANSHVILTFDVALSPLSPFGFSSVELKAFARTMRTRIPIPEDILHPSQTEMKFWASQIGVCLLRVERIDGRWPMLRLSKIHRYLSRIHRIVQERVFQPRKTLGILRKLTVDRQGSDEP